MTIKRSRFRTGIDWKTWKRSRARCLTASIDLWENVTMRLGVFIFAFFKRERERAQCYLFVCFDINSSPQSMQEHPHVCGGLCIRTWNHLWSATYSNVRIKRNWIWQALENLLISSCSSGINSIRAVTPTNLPLKWIKVYSFRRLRAQPSWIG